MWTNKGIKRRKAKLKVIHENHFSFRRFTHEFSSIFFFLIFIAPENFIPVETKIKAFAIKSRWGREASIRIWKCVGKCVSVKWKFVWKTHFGKAWYLRVLVKLSLWSASLENSRVYVFPTFSMCIWEKCENRFSCFGILVLALPTTCNISILHFMRWKYICWLLELLQ